MHTEPDAHNRWHTWDSNGLKMIFAVNCIIVFKVLIRQYDVKVNYLISCKQHYYLKLIYRKWAAASHR